MLAFGQYPQSFPPQFSYHQDEIKEEPFLTDMMEPCPTYDSMGFSSMFADGQQDFKYEMLRSMSQNIQQTHAEAAPSLLSSTSAPSLPSASSSTVGSPYSGHAQPVVNQYMYTNQYMNGPAIICEDSFPYGYESAHYEPEAVISQDAKISGSFVGKSADLSSFARRSSPVPVQEFTPPVPLVSSPAPVAAVPNPSHLSPTKQHRIPDEAAQFATPARGVAPQNSQALGVFKSPTTPASAYPKPSYPSPNARRMTCPDPVQSPQDSFRFSYTYPFSSHQSTQHASGNPQYSFFSQTSGNSILPIEASYPILISGQQSPFLNASYGVYQAPQQPHFSPAASPAPSSHSYHSFSQPVTVENFGTQHANMRRQSIGSIKSGASPRSYSADEDTGNKGRCPYPDCGRVFKDLKAHMMTHDSVRPEKCPIVSCEYNKKGFARKYDKNRHTLTHYRGTMVCGFCPGSGSAAEKSFNRADVFKRHLTSVHGVEQTPPNSRKRSPSKSNVKLSSYCQDATGKCSTCGSTFNNAQEFYEHLDDCVLKVVQQEDPAESVNAQRLAEVAHDADVQATFERNHLKSEDSLPSMEEDDEEDEDEDEEDEEEEDELEMNERSGKGVIRATKTTSNRPIIGGNISKKTSKKGLTWSRGGGSIIGKSRKRRKFYPPSWGMATDKMNMKKRVLCVYDGQRRLLKDDMMMHNEFEVRLPLQDSNSYVTDLDLETMKRAEAFHSATAEEKGPWIPEQDFLQEFLP